MERKDIRKEIRERILVLDGATGTLIQTRGLQEDDFTLEKYGSLRGLNDILCLTRPEAVAEVHRQYLESGADIISTNTFNANAISLAEYGVSDLVPQINAEAARIARRVADEFAADGKPRFVAGVVGPTGRTASISPDVADPAARNVTFDELFDTYSNQIRTLADNGADLILIETVFDSLNAKAPFALPKASASCP